MLITAGPTHEPIDAVRYIANRSTGRLGIAVAEAAVHQGRSTTLLLGPTPLQPPEDSRLTTIRFRTTADLQALLNEHWPAHDILVMAAAVADYRPADPAGPSSKRPRGGTSWMVELVPTPDLLAEAAAAARPDQITIGFALEAPDDLVERARRKLAAKRVDAIVANPLATIGSDRIDATVFLRDGQTLRPPGPDCTKREFAVWLLDLIGGLPARKNPGRPAAS